MEKEKDFVLSEKEINSLNNTSDEHVSLYHADDVKEFIRRLKKDVCSKWCGTNDGRYPECKFCKAINRRAGEGLQMKKITQEDVDKARKAWEKNAREARKAWGVWEKAWEKNAREAREKVWELEKKFKKQEGLKDE